MKETENQAEVKITVKKPLKTKEYTVTKVTKKRKTDMPKTYLSANYLSVPLKQMGDDFNIPSQEIGEGVKTTAASNKKILKVNEKTKEEQKVEEAKAKKSEAIEENKKAFKDASVAQYFGIGNTKEQEAAMKKQYEAQIELNKAQAERQVKELTDEEIRHIQAQCHLKNVGYDNFIMRFARAILKKAQEK